MILNRLIPEPTGFDDEVKAKAARAERGWEAITGMITFLGAGGTAAVAAGFATPPIAPFLAALAAGSFYFKLRAKWAKEDPPRPDFAVATDFEPPRLDLMPLLPGFIPQGVSIVSLVYGAGASVEATVVSAERAMGAAVAEWDPAYENPEAHWAERVREIHQHADRTKLLTRGLHVAAIEFGQFMQQQPQESVAAGHAAPLANTLSPEILGRLIAAGVDLSLLAAEVPTPENWASPQPLFAEAGEAAEQLGAALASWGHAESLRTGV